MMKKILYFYIFVFFLLSIFLVYFMQQSKKREMQSFAKVQLEVLQKTYDTVLNMQLSKAQKDFYYLVKQNKAVHEVLQEALEAPADKLPVLRGRLYRLLYKEYISPLNSDLRQLHFHTPQGDSFLRFHKPAFNGDNLFSLRKSIKIANTQLQRVHGFEGGRVFPGFRNVFPIVIEGQHLGSVEFSYSFETIEKELKKVLSANKYQLIQNKAATLQIVNDEFKNHFIASDLCSKYVIENPDISTINKQLQRDEQIKSLNKKLQVCTKLEEALQNESEDFAKPMFHEQKGYLINFLKVHSIDPNEHAYIISYEQMPELVSINKKYDFFTVLGFIGILFVCLSGMFLHYRKIQLDEKNKKITAQTNFLHNILENAPIPIFYKDKRGRYINCNSKFLELLGFDHAHEVIGKTVYDLYPKKFAKKYDAMDQKMWSLEETSQNYGFEAFNKKTQQKRKHLEFHKRVYFNPEGELEGLVGAIIDMNEVYQNLKEKEKYFSASNYSPSIIVMSDLEGIIEYVNPAFCKVTGYRKEEMVGKSAYELGLEDSQKIKEAITGEKVYEADMVNRKKDGSTYIQRTKIAPYYDQDAKMAGFVSVGEDITKLKELEKIQIEYTQKLESMVGLKVKELRKKDSLLIQQSKMAAMGEMIGAIAHQWRQPLNALSINIQLLEDDYEDGLIDRVYIDDFTKRMLYKIQYMDQTIDDFRNFFKPQRERSTFLVSKSVEDTLKLVDASYKASNIEVIKKDFDESCKVYGLQNEFNQVLINIFKNSKDAVVQNKIEDAKVYIGLACSDGKVTLQVWDNAGGVEKDLLQKVFDPYFSTKEKSGGTGIGLYMSKVIIEQNMKGQILMENYNEGVKTVIKL